MLRGFRLCFSIIAFVAGPCLALQGAPENISSVAYSVTNGTSTPTDGFSYDNTIEAVTDFSGVSGTGYTVISSAPHALVQRNGLPDQSSVWYAISGSTGNLAGVNQSDYPTLLRSNNLLEGADNVFVNSNPGKPISTGNIERLDYTWSAPFADLSKLAFAVFERGNVGVHDAFTIAIVTGVAANGTPTTYGAFLRVAAGWGGTANLTATVSNQLLRYSNRDDISTRSTAVDPTTDQTMQGVGGIVFKVSDFNLAGGAQVYGYSLLGSDVAPATPNDLLDVTNTAVYLNTTTDSNGGIDLAAVNGLQIQYAPEPGAWALLGVGGLLFGGLGFANGYRLHRPVA